MSIVVGLGSDPRAESFWLGTRMSADEYLALPSDGQNYELVDGVVVMSPSPTPEHQHVAGEIFAQLAVWLREHPVGLAFIETDVHIGRGPTGGDLVYKPEIVFVRRERLPEVRGRIACVPDLVVEVISPPTRRFDTQTKKDDYERLGVGEYWLIDPDRKAMTFYRLEDGRFVDVPPTGDSFASQAVPGFTLDLARVRQAFEPW